MAKMKVRFLATVVEAGVRYPVGSIAKLDEERVRALGEIVEILEKETKKPPKNKSISSAAKSK